MFQVDVTAAKQRMNELQEEYKQCRLARQYKPTKKNTAKHAWRVLMMSFRWWQ
jgi:hypothetical protein